MNTRRFVACLLCLALLMTMGTALGVMSFTDENGNEMTAGQQAALAFDPDVMEQMYAVSLSMLTEDYDAETLENIRRYYTLSPIANEDGSLAEVEISGYSYTGFRDQQDQFKLLFYTGNVADAPGHIVIQSNYAAEGGVAAPLAATLYALDLLSRDTQILSWFVTAQSGDTYENDFYTVMYYSEAGVDVLMVFAQDDEAGETAAEETATDENWDQLDEMDSLSDLYIWNDTFVYIGNEHAVSIYGLYGMCELPDSGELVIPPVISGRPVVQIGRQAFSGRDDLIRVSVPSSVQRIRDAAFDDMSALAEVILEDGVERIECTFRNCPRLTNVRIPASVTSIDEGAFRGLDPYFHLTVDRGSYAEEYAKARGIACLYADEAGDSVALQPGNIVTFGSYADAPLEWIVLKVQDGEAMLLTRDVLNAQAYSPRDATVWAGSFARRILNEELIYRLFSVPEANILSAHEINDPASPYSISGIPGSASVCRLFLLSYFEARDLLPTDEARAASQGWWLRTARDYGSEYVHYVSADGRLQDGMDSESELGIRPAIWVQTDCAGDVLRIVDDGTWQAAQPAQEDADFGVGSIVRFGSYEQDNDDTNGAEPLYWRVLSVDGTSATLITQYCVDVRRYHGEERAVNWGECDLRNWLNDEFFNAAFTSGEQGMMLRTSVENFDTDTANGTYMPSYMIDPVVSNDMVWILDYDEAKGYLPGIEDQLAYVTNYALAKGVATNNEGYGHWMLRADKNDRCRTNVMLPYQGGASVAATRTDIAVRPVIRVDLVALGVMDEAEAAAAAAAEQDAHPDSAGSLRALLVEFAGSDAIPVFECADYDGDGSNEAFAIVGSRDDSGIMHGELWFVKPNEGRKMLRDVDFVRAERLRDSAPCYFVAVEGDAQRETASHFLGVQDGRCVELDWEDYVRLSEQASGTGFTNLPDDASIEGGVDFTLEWKPVDEAGLYYISLYRIGESGEEAVYAAEAWERDGRTVTIPGRVLTESRYRVQISAWIGSCAHNDRELYNTSVEFSVRGGATEASSDSTDYNLGFSVQGEATEAPSDSTDYNLGFITPLDGATIQAGQKLELEWTPIPGAKCYSMSANVPSFNGSMYDWSEFFYNAETSCVIPRSTLVAPSYQLELKAWKDDNLRGGREIFTQTIEIRVHDKFNEDNADAASGAPLNEMIISGDFTYRVQEDGTAAFVGFNGNGDLVIPEVIDGHTVTAIADNACCWCSALRTVRIPATVRSIGAGAFSWCGYLEWVEMSEGIERIGDNAFSRCGKLQSVDFPDSVTGIGESVLSGCEQLTHVELPAQLTDVGGNLLSECASLQSVVIPSGVTVIPESSFFNCTALSSVTLPEGLTEIGGMAFYNCAALQEIDIPSTTRSIGEWAFADCRALIRRSMPEGVQLGEGAFLNCPL